MSICKVIHCDSDVIAKGYCWMHYRKFKKYGHTSGEGRIFLDDHARFHSKIELILFTTCWWWSGGVNKHGYGVFAAKGFPSQFAHRYSYSIYVGEIKSDTINDPICVMHSCDNPMCVNPDHLSLGSRADNNRDMVNKSRQARGDASGASKLTEDDVSEIKSLYGRSPYRQSDIAKIYGVTHGAIGHIFQKRTWRHVAPK